MIFAYARAICYIAVIGALTPEKRHFSESVMFSVLDSFKRWLFGGLHEKKKRTRSIV